MSQATLGSGPYRNSHLFSGYYIDECVADLDAWDCDAEAEEAFEQIRDLWDQESTLLASYKEDELIDTWIAEILDILGYGTSSEVTLPDGGGYVDRLLFESEDVRRNSAEQSLGSNTEGHFSRSLSILEANSGKPTLRSSSPNSARIATPLTRSSSTSNGHRAISTGDPHWREEVTTLRDEGLRNTDLLRGRLPGDFGEWEPRGVQVFLRLLPSRSVRGHGRTLAGRA